MAKKLTLDKAELKKVLNETGWSQIKAAKRFGVHRNTIKRNIDEHKIEVPENTFKPKGSVQEETEAYRLRRRITDLESFIKEVQDERLKDSDLNRLFISASEAELRPPKILKVPKGKRVERAVATALFSDQHYDEVVRPEEFNFVNAYNRDIAVRRTQLFFENVIKVAEQYINGIQVDALVLAMLGDMMSGIIHEELRRTNEAPILDGLLFWSEHVAAGIMTLLEHFPEIYVPCIVGNHGRLDQKISFKNRVRDNFDWLLYHMIARYFKDISEVTFNIPESADFQYPVYDTNYYLTHGDQFRGGTGIAGILTPVFIGDQRKSKRSVALRRPYDHMLIGHFHQRRDFGPVVINGTLKGYDEYAFLNNFQFEPPQQHFFLTDPRRGKTISAPIFCTKEDEVYGTERNRDAAPSGEGPAAGRGGIAA